ncbi:MAG: hypothetical protein IKE91_01095 [Clostridia bacterium]|nr:hypothetical protein [Clostridia bacterium]
MFSKSGYNDNLRELIKANKADKSIVTIIKGNLEVQSNAKNIIKKNEKEIKVLTNNNKKNETIKTQTSIKNLKEFISIRKEIKDIKKQIKKMTNEVKVNNKKKYAAEMHNSELEKEIENQFKIYQENEVYAKAFEKIDKNIIKLPDEFYKSYNQHMELYNNSVYSVKNKSKLPEPKAEDFLGVLNALKESEEKQKRKAKRKAAAASKKATTKTTTKKTVTKKDDKKEDTKKTTTKKAEPKKTETKKATSTKKVETKKSEPKKTETKKTTSKSTKTTTKK